MIYTALRLVVFFASLAIIIGVWMLLRRLRPGHVGRGDRVRGQRRRVVLPAQPAARAFARRVEVRADRATARFEEMKAREDADDADHRDA